MYTTDKRTMFLVCRGSKQWGQPYPGELVPLPATPISLILQLIILCMG